MTILKQQKLNVWAVEMNGESSLPMLYDCGPIGEPGNTDLGEDDGLWVGYGSIRSAFPYRSQD